MVAPDISGYLAQATPLRVEPGEAPAPVIAGGRFGRLARGSSGEQHLTVLGRRREPVPELPLDRGDVLAIIGGLSDIYADTQAILRILEEEDDDEEEEP